MFHNVNNYYNRAPPSKILIMNPSSPDDSCVPPDRVGFCYNSSISENIWGPSCQRFSYPALYWRQMSYEFASRSLTRRLGSLARHLLFRLFVGGMHKMKYIAAVLIAVAGLGLQQAQAQSPLNTHFTVSSPIGTSACNRRQMTHTDLKCVM